MGNRLNQQSPLCRLKDSLEKERKLEDRHILPLNCYGENVNNTDHHLSKNYIDIHNKKQNITFSYEKRMSIAKWFQRYDALNENIARALRISLIWLNNRIKAKPINPIENKYISIEHIANLGIDTDELQKKIANDNRGAFIEKNVFSIKKHHKKHIKIRKKNNKIKPINKSKTPEKINFEEVVRLARKSSNLSNNNKKH